MEHVEVAGLQIRTRSVAAEFYTRWAEPQPENAPDEWFLAGPTDAVVSVDSVSAALTGLGEVIDGLTPHMDEEAIQSLFYEAAKDNAGDERGAMRDFFRYLYQFVLQSPSGPRWGQFVTIIGVDGFIDLVQRRAGEHLMN